MEVKLCRICETEKPISSFYQRASYCKKCNRHRVAVYRKRLREATDDEESGEFAVVEELVPAVEENPPDHLYVLHNPKIPGESKIGRSRDVTARAKDLSKSQNFSMVIDHTYTGQGFLETVIHRRLKNIRIMDGDGREWYRIDPASLNMIISGVIVEASTGCM